MRVSELRVGNWIEDWIDKRNGLIIRQIDLEDFCMIFNYGNHPLPFKPIPLTEEWLMKFGFISNAYQDRYEKRFLFIQCNKTKGFLELFIEGYHHIKYIHQLQNFYFALTGEELEVKL